MARHYSRKPEIKTHSGRWTHKIMHFLVSRGFVLAIRYILKNYRALVNNLNPVLVKLLFIYFLGLQSNKFPGRSLIHRPNPSIHLCRFFEEILLNTECSNYSFHCPYIILPFLGCSAQSGSHSWGVIPERQKLVKVWGTEEQRMQEQQRTGLEHGCIYKVMKEQEPAIGEETDRGRTEACGNSDFIFCCYKFIMQFRANCLTLTYAWSYTENCLYTNHYH